MSDEEFERDFAIRAMTDPEGFLAVCEEIINDETTDRKKCGAIINLAVMLGKAGAPHTAQAFYDRWSGFLLKDIIPSDKAKVDGMLRDDLKLPKVGIVATDRLDFDTAKKFIWRNMTPERLASLSEGHRLMAKALMEAADEKEALKEIRRMFYRLSPSERFMIVKEAFDDESEDVGILRQLISELPEEQQRVILGG